MLTRHLALAEDHVALGKRHIDMQHELIAGLLRNGHDAAQARELLATFEELQLAHTADRERIQRELAHEA